MSGNHSRNKGASFERELVNDARAKDIRARRVPLSGATEYAKDDVELLPSWEADWADAYRVECKRVAKLPVIFRALGKADVLAVREDRGETLIVIRASLFLDLLQ